MLQWCVISCGGAAVYAAGRWLSSALQARRQRRQQNARKALGRHGTPLKVVVAQCEARWFLEALQAAMAGDSEAMVRLSHMLMAGYGTKQDPHAAAAWMRQAWAIQNYKEPALLHDMLDVRDSPIPALNEAGSVPLRPAAAAAAAAAAAMRNSSQQQQHWNSSSGGSSRGRGAGGTAAGAAGGDAAGGGGTHAATGSQETAVGGAAATAPNAAGHQSSSCCAVDAARQPSGGISTPQQQQQQTYAHQAQQVQMAGHQEHSSLQLQPQLQSHTRDNRPLLGRTQQGLRSRRLKRSLRQQQQAAAAALQHLHRWPVAAANAMAAAGRMAAPVVQQQQQHVPASCQQLAGQLT